MVEDEVKLANLLKRSLEIEHYTVEAAYDGMEAYDMALKNEYDIIILDVMLPKMDGFTVCKQIRNQHIRTPIIMLTARDTIDDRVTGLDSGSDDYLIKPFGFEELIARMRSLLRRQSGRYTEQLSVKDLVLDLGAHEVRRGKDRIELSPKEFALLKVLLENKGEALSRKRLLDSVWGDEQNNETNQLDVYIRHLRRKVDEPYTDELIRTVRGVGYKISES